MPPVRRTSTVFTRFSWGLPTAETASTTIWVCTGFFLSSLCLTIWTSYLVLGNNLPQRVRKDEKLVVAYCFWNIKELRKDFPHRVASENTTCVGGLKCATGGVLLINPLLLQDWLPSHVAGCGACNEADSASRHDFSSLMHGFFRTEPIRALFYSISMNRLRDEASFMLEKKCLDEGLMKNRESMSPPSMWHGQRLVIIQLQP